MTVAVCLNCGELKHGAFTKCFECGYTPNDDESLTKHILVTDHYHDQQTLKAIAERVKAGQAIEFDPDTLKKAWVSKAELNASGRRFAVGWAIFLLAIIALAVGVLAVAYFRG